MRQTFWCSKSTWMVVGTTGNRRMFRKRSTAAAAASDPASMHEEASEGIWPLLNLAMKLGQFSLGRKPKNPVLKDVMYRE